LVGGVVVCLVVGVLCVFFFLCKGVLCGGVFIVWLSWWGVVARRGGSLVGGVFTVWGVCLKKKASIQWVAIGRDLKGEKTGKGTLGIDYTDGSPYQVMVDTKTTRWVRNTF